MGSRQSGIEIINLKLEGHVLLAHKDLEADQVGLFQLRGVGYADNFDGVCHGGAFVLEERLRVIAAQHVERMLEVGRVFAFDFQPLPRTGVGETEFHGVQPLAVQVDLGR